jgi:mycothiol synthase
MGNQPHAPAGYETDLQSVVNPTELARLIVHVETANDGSSPTTESFVSMLLNAPDIDPDHGTIAVRDASTSDLVAFGLYRDPEPHVESATLGWVHPSHRGHGLGTMIVQWGLNRARSRIPIAPEGTRVTNRCQASDSDTDAAALFTDLGYHPDRHEIEMEYTFDGPVTVAHAPAGVEIRTAAGDTDVTAVARVSSSAFKDHYGWAESSWEQTLERWKNFRSMDEWDDDLVFIAEIGGEAIGELVGIRSHGANMDTGYIGSLGVLRAWRGKGLARSLLTRAFAEYQARGMHAVALDVDADSLTGATRLYSDVGMQPVRSETAFLIELRPGTDLVTR